MRHSFLIFCAVGLVACSAVEPEPRSSSHALSGSVGVLHVDRTVEGATVDGVGGSTVLRAAFARYRGIDGEAVLRLLGSGSAAGVGRCALSDPAGVDPAGALGAGELGTVEADVELVDVGALHVSVADTETRLSPRTFPDLASVLAGVFYAGDGPLATPVPELDEYRFRADGSFEVGAFEVVVPAPAAPRGLALVGADGTSAVLDGRLTEVSPSAAVTLLWDADDPRDLVEIELTAAGQTLACLAHDEGAFRISADDLSMVIPDLDARLTVRRVRATPFDAPGIEVAYARVAAERSFPIALR
jgi:hypothetical protein